MTLNSAAIQNDKLIFRTDWFSYRQPIWEKLFHESGPLETVLEVGCFEGRATCYFLQHLMASTGKMYCLDSWESAAVDWIDRTHIDLSVEDLFRRNIEIACQPEQYIEVLKGKSFKSLARLITEDKLNYFQVVYIDGSHTAPDVLTDACMAWPLLQPGGLMIFDDYHWELQLAIEDRPKLAIDAFTALFNSRIKTIFVGGQYIFQKIAA